MEQATRPLLILGTRTFAEETADVASEIAGVQVVGFVENMDRQRCKEKLNGLPIIWVDELAELSETHQVICGLGTTHRSRYVEQVAQFKVSFATLVHPSARISGTSSVGEGSFISSGAIVAARTQVGKHVVLNRGALVGHHSQVGSFATVGPGANIAGNSRVGEGTYIGISAVVLDHISVGCHSVVGAGAVVTRDVPDNVQVVGVPAKIVKRDIEGK